MDIFCFCFLKKRAKQQIAVLEKHPQVLALSLSRSLSELFAASPALSRSRSRSRTFIFFVPRGTP